ncbi:MAG: EF-P 5-aminopentanol modification-associated protein YfmF [Faecalibacillus sp.]|uniref:EF-P 5-aminopentanol modification-associated protein YfmF n=1 Tax=Faecalibacillus sp. TaxID=2678891 RepID=UPI003999C7C5
MEKVYKMTGYDLHLIPTNKFKNITISLKLQNTLDEKTVAKRTLLSFMLTTGTKKYPSTQELSKYLESMYGMKLGANVVTKGKSHIINVNSICINQEYLPYKENLIQQQIQLLNDIFFNPNASKNCFDEAMFARKKKELIERLINNQDDKFYYSLEKMFEYMGKGTCLGISSHGNIEDIKEIKNEELFSYFKECIKNDKKHIYVVLNVDESIVQVFKNCLIFENNDLSFESVYSFEKNRKDLLEIIEKQDITQAKLNMGYRIPVNYNSQNHYAFVVFNAIFGGMSQSKLFKVVREKNSLCYYISSSYDAFNGVMIITAGIEGKDYYQTVQLIKEQLKEMQEGHFDQNDIDIAKLMIKNSMKKTNDEPLSQVAVQYNRDITGKEETNEQYLERIEKVTYQDIIDVCQNIELDTIFLLKGRNE